MSEKTTTKAAPSTPTSKKTAVPKSLVDLGEAIQAAQANLDALNTQRDAGIRKVRKTTPTCSNTAIGLALGISPSRVYEIVNAEKILAKKAAKKAGKKEATS